VTLRDGQKGKAFEYLILRAFELDGAEVKWPYPVSLYGQGEVIEEIDGSVRINALYCLIETRTKTGTLRSHPLPN